MQGQRVRAWKVRMNFQGRRDCETEIYVRESNNVVGHMRNLYIDCAPASMRSRSPRPRPFVSRAANPVPMSKPISKAHDNRSTPAVDFAPRK
jgi:hypothetical protein